MLRWWKNVGVVKMNGRGGVVFMFKDELNSMLQEAISSVDYEFEIEDIIAKQVGAVPLPFPGMDSTVAEKTLDYTWILMFTHIRHY